MATIGKRPRHPGRTPDIGMGPALWGAARGLAGVLGSGARGALSATLGWPGDLESLASEFLLGEEPQPTFDDVVLGRPGRVRTVLPTSEDFREWLPDVPESIRQPAFEEIGLFGVMPPKAIARGLAPAGKATGSAVNRAMLEGTGPLGQVLGAARPAFMAESGIPDDLLAYARQLERQQAASPLDVLRNNASGESAASLEALSRQASERAAGRNRIRVRADGSIVPLIGPEAVDATAYPGEVILQRGIGADPTGWSVLDTYRGMDPGDAIRRAEKYGSGNYAGGGLIRGALKRAMQAMSEYEKPTLNVVKERGGNWLTGSVEDLLHPIRPMVKGYPSADALDAWIQGPLTKYVKRDMATPEDPIRALAERGILHVNPEELNINLGRYLQSSPMLGEKRLAETDLGKAWEGASDLVPVSTTVGEYQSSPFYNQFRAANPWASKLSPDDPIFNIAGDVRPGDLGFNHLTDELHNAMNPASGLPRELLLRPESLQRMSVPQAVQRVHDINKWRAAREVEANAAIANNAATHVVKEYPEQGMKWVELKHSEENPQALEDALKYEGDTMKHCVGGYCEDVASGKSRIFSLRDAQGRPHVTVETKPTSFWTGDPYSLVEDVVQGMTKSEHKQWARALEENGWDDIGDYVDSLEETYGRQLAPHDSVAFSNEVMEMMPKSVQARVRKAEAEFVPEVSIVQVKGGANQKPKPEYIPFVQDFVKSRGPWHDIGDFQNTDLYRRSGLPKEEQDLAAHLGDYLTMDEIKKLREEASRPWTPLDNESADWKEGGLVSGLDDIVQQFGGRRRQPQRMAGGVVDDDLQSIIQQFGGRIKANA